MLADVFGVTPDELYIVAGNLDEAKSRMAGLMSTLAGQLADAAAEGPPWGEGDSGDQFASSYLPQLQSVFDNIGAAINTCDYWSEYLTGLALDV